VARALAAQIADALDPTGTASAAIRADELQALVTQLIARVQPRRLAADLIRAALTAGTGAADDELAALKTAAGIESTPAGPGLEATFEALTTQLADRLSAANNSLRSAVARVTGQAAAQVIAGQASGRVASDQVFQRLIEHGPTIRDEAGRQWELGSFAEMSVRTATHSAWNAGHETQMRARGVDLVHIIVSHAGCELCGQFAGTVLALDSSVVPGQWIKTHDVHGELIDFQVDGSLDDAREAGFQHPNCRCVIVAFIPGLSETTQDPQQSDDLYDQTQRQRAIERTIRSWRSRQAAAVTPEQKATAKAKVKLWTRALTEHIAAHPGLKRSRKREAVQLGSKAGKPMSLEV
jgi:hypothetical protein